MKILIISKLYGLKAGARGIQVYKLIKLLLEEGIEIDLITASNSEEFNHKKLNIYYFDVPKPKNIFQKVFLKFKEEYWNASVNNQVVKSIVNTYYSIKNLKHDILLTISYPFYTHIAGLFIHNINKTKWITFFSDPFPFLPEVYMKIWDKLFLSQKIKLYNNISLICDAVILPSHKQLQYMNQKPCNNIISKSNIIPHIGFNHDDVIDEYMVKLLNDNFLVYLGNLTKERTSVNLVKALNAFNSDYKNYFAGLLVFGRVSEKFLRIKKKFDSNKIIYIMQNISFYESIKIASQARCLLLIEANMKFSPFLPSKLADYVSGNVPIMAITPKESEVRNILSNDPYRICVMDDFNEIFNGLKYIFFEKQFIKAKMVENKYFKPEEVLKAYKELFKF